VPRWETRRGAPDGARRCGRGCRRATPAPARPAGSGCCSCRPSFQAQIWSPRERKPIWKSFRELAEAVAWRQEAQVALRRGTLRAPSPSTLREAAEEWLAAAEAGVIRTRSGDRYKPSALRSYRQALYGKVLPELGSRRLTAVMRNTVQDLVDQLVAAGQAPSTVRNTILPLRAIYRRALLRGDVAINPTLKLELPAVGTRRDRIARRDEAASSARAKAARDSSSPTATVDRSTR